IASCLVKKSLMRKLLLSALGALLAFLSIAQELKVTGPDGRLEVLFFVENGNPFYKVRYDGTSFLEKSPLGLKTSIGDFAAQLSIKGHKVKALSEDYTLNRSKQSQVHYEANELTATMVNKQQQNLDIIFRVSNND